MPCRHSEVEILLKKLKKEMIISHLWADVSPPELSLESTVPFAFDKMPFENWLQFIFIPKMLGIVALKSNLPERLSLMPMAEQCFHGLPHLSRVLLVIAEIDRKFSCFSRESRV
ncbi:MAG: YqcC family protein [Paraglaciecola sp.]